MAQPNSGETGGVSIRVNVKLHESPKGEKTPDVVAYAFTSSGHFITKANVNGEGDASLRLPGIASAREIRVVVGPAVADEQQPTLSELTRRGAKEQFVRVGPKDHVPAITLEIRPEIWLCWIRFCFAQGKLLKRVVSAGLPLDLPVCNADVQIWEVEPIEFIIAKLPDLEIEKLRRVIINPPDPAPVERLATASRNLQVARPVATFDARAVQTSSALGNLQFIAQRSHTAELRQALIENAAVSRLFICELIPLFVTKTLVATTTTDRCGRFESFIFLSCFSPNPNLYFTASVDIFVFSIPIYEPVPVACYTYWNYQCGTEVALFTESIFAPTCSPCPPVDATQNYVLFRAIGNVALDTIYGTSSTLAASTTNANIGQIANGAGPGLNAPFGSVSNSLPLLPRIEFDNSLRDSNLAKYYQISYRFGTTGSFAPLVGEINRPYDHFVASVGLVTSRYLLGPDPIGAPKPQLFEIPPSLPPEGGWAFPDPRYDLANAQFPSSDLPVPAIAGGTHGKYQIKLDLFDSLGNPVDIAAAGIAYFVPTTVDPDGTIHTADASTLGLVNGNSFIMTLHIDNRPTFGALGTPALDGNPTDTCGVFRYLAGVGGPAGVVSIPFTATQPDDFATYSYRLSRGAVLLEPPTSSGPVSAATNPMIISISAKSLLTEILPDGTSSICDVAGFAEDLYVAAMATNGWSRLSEYDKSPPPRAFVLAPTT